MADGTTAQRDKKLRPCSGLVSDLCGSVEGKIRNGFVTTVWGTPKEDEMYIFLCVSFSHIPFEGEMSSVLIY